MSVSNLVIAQITDMHIGSSDSLYRGIKVRQKFLNVLQALAKKKLDLLVLTGDLSALEGEPEAYAWMSQVLAEFPYPYIVMPGNHDHVVRMSRAFKLPDGEISQGMLYFNRTISGKRLLFLDSSPSYITRRQLEWLSAQLADYKKQVLLFIHHPPLFCDCQFMDARHSLRNIEEVWQVLEQLPQVKHVFCGHYHTEKTVIKNNKNIYLTPSTIFQIDTNTPHFAVEHTTPGWRIIKWGEEIQTYVEYYKSSENS